MDQTADDFVHSICAEVIDSAAVRHPYLQALENGDFPNLDLALQDFAFQYGLYSAKFTRYVSAVIRNLQDQEHRQILLANLAEEQGEVAGIELPPAVLESVVGEPHSLLFHRFQKAVGVDADYNKENKQSPASHNWSRKFLALCEKNEFVGIGAIGIGTELIVSRIYDQILMGLRDHSRLTMIERVFFDLHSQCDEEHAAQVIKIAQDLAQDEEAREQIEYGARTAVDLRVSFWDEMLERAQSFPSPSAPLAKRNTAVAY